MSTIANKKGADPAQPGSPYPLELNTTPQEAPTSPQEAPEASLPANPRLEAPKPPRGLIGQMTQDALARVSLCLQQGEADGRAHPDTGWDAAARAAQALNLSHLHPLAYAYRAEAVEYLRARGEQARSAAEAEQASAVADAKRASRAVKDGDNRGD